MRLKRIRAAAEALVKDSETKTVALQKSDEQKKQAREESMRRKEEKERKKTEWAQQQGPPEVLTAVWTGGNVGGQRTPSSGKARSTKINPANLTTTTLQALGSLTVKVSSVKKVSSAQQTAFEVWLEATKALQAALQ